MDELNGTFCVICGEFTTDGLAHKECRETHTPEQIKELWEKHCEPTYESPWDVY
jgi:hypothetical protein